MFAERFAGYAPLIAGGAAPRRWRQADEPAPRPPVGAGRPGPGGGIAADGRPRLGAARGPGRADRGGTAARAAVASGGGADAGPARGRAGAGRDARGRGRWSCCCARQGTWRCSSARCSCAACATLAAVGAFWGHQQIGDLISYLRALANPLDERALYSALASPLAGCSYDCLALLADAARADRRGVWETALAAAAGAGVEDVSGERDGAPAPTSRSALHRDSRRPITQPLRPSARACSVSARRPRGGRSRS